MAWGVFESFGSLIRSVAHSVKSGGESVSYGWQLLTGAGIDIWEEDFGIACNQFSDLNTFTNSLESISSDYLIPVGFHTQRDKPMAARYEYVIGTEWTNPEGELEKPYMTIVSDKRLSQDEILGSDLIPECTTVYLGIDEELPWQILEAYTY